MERKKGFSDMIDAHRIDIRWLSLDDMPEAAALEALCFSSCWTVQQFEESFQQDWYAGYGLFIGDTMAGYISLSVLAGELEVLNIALHPDHRGKGLSRRLMHYALADTLAGGHCRRRNKEPEGWENGVLEVRVGNAPARSLYRSLGFKDVGIRKKYYSDGEDAVIMTLESAAFPQS